MKNRKICLFVTLLLVLTLLFTFSVSAAPRQIKISHATAPGDPRDKGALALRDYINANLEDMEAVVYPASQLGEASQTIEAMQAGAIEIVILPSAFLGGFEPLVTLLDVPFFLPGDFDDLLKIQNSDAAKALLDTTQHVGIVSLDFWSTGYKQWTSNKPLRKPEDFAGLKWRIMPSPVLEEMYKELGARPVFVPFEELYSALQTGAADGQGDCPIALIANMHFNEVQRYISVSNYGPSEMLVMASKLWYDSLSKDVQEIIQKAAEEGAKVCADAAKNDQDQRWREIEEKGGTEFVILTEEEIEMFREKTKGVQEFYVSKYGEKAKKIIDDYRIAIEKLK